MSGGNDHNTSAGDKSSLPVFHEVQHGAPCKVKADTVAKVLALRTWSVTGLAQETSRRHLSEKCLLSLKDFQGWAIFITVREIPLSCVQGLVGHHGWTSQFLAEGPGQQILILITLWCSIHGQSRGISTSSLARVNSSWDAFKLVSQTWSRKTPDRLKKGMKKIDEVLRWGFIVSVKYSGRSKRFRK